MGSNSPSAARAPSPQVTGAAGQSLSIVHVVANGGMGGLEQVVRALALGHAHLGHRVLVAAVVDDSAGDQFVKLLEQSGVDTVTLKVAPRSYREEQASLERLLTAYRPDVVHTHGYRSDVIDAPVARRLAIPTITTVHGRTGGNWKNWIYESLQRRAFRRFDAVVAVSVPLARTLAKRGLGDRVRLIPNGYQPQYRLLDRDSARCELGIARDRFAIGWIGRLSREKGPDVLVDAVTHLRSDSLSVSIVGAGPLATELRGRSKALGVENKITFHGQIPEAGRLLRAFDVFVLSSRTEGTPIVVLEAMGAGVPIVASSVGGIPHMIGATEALLVKSDDPRALATAIASVFDNPRAALERATAARARQHADFRIEDCLSRYEQLYRSIRTRRILVR